MTDETEEGEELDLHGLREKMAQWMQEHHAVYQDTLLAARVLQKVSGEVPYDKMTTLMQRIQVEGRSPIWICTNSTYDKVYWYAHCRRAYPPPVRKLRKCWMRKRQQRIARERKRYLV